MTVTFYVLVVITLTPNSTYNMNFKRFETKEECLYSATTIDVMTNNFTKCVERQERID